MKIKILPIFLLLVLVFSCKPEIDEFVPDRGSADFSKYVAVGGGLAAGYGDAALYRSSQTNSFANILAGQFQLVGGGSFKQPLMVDDVGIAIVGKKRVLAMAADCKGVVSLTPVLTSEATNPQNLASIAAQGPYNNMGVPFMKSFHANVQGYGNLNPFFGRFMSSPTASVIADAAAQQASFFTMWLGVEDVMVYTMKGGDQGGDSLTARPLFNQVMNLLSGLMVEDGAKGAIANVPDVTAFPYCTTVTAKGLPLDANTAAALNNAYNALYNNQVVALGIDSVKFTAGNNYWVVADPNPVYNTVGNRRQLKQGELLLLSVPQDSLKCAGWGTSPLKPAIPAYYVLDANEISKIRIYIASYNQVIATIASGLGLALVDMNGQMKNFQGGMYFDGIRISTAFVTGGLFSLDGIHLNPRGNAVVANCFIESINQKFGSTIPLVNIGDYPGILFP